MPGPLSVTSMIDEGRGFDAALYRLLAWFSPMFPIGAFSYSHGLEAAAERGKAHDRGSLQRWITAVLAHGAGRIDAHILRDAHRAALAADIEVLNAANRRGLAYRATTEMTLESTAQGAAFLAACRAAWPDPRLHAWAATFHDGPVCCAAAVGGATAWAGIALGCALTAYLQAMTANLVSAGLRLGLVGQTNGQRILSALEPIVDMAVASALIRDSGAFGGAAFAIDLASMAHETQYTRLFRT